MMEVLKSRPHGHVKAIKQLADYPWPSPDRTQQVTPEMPLS
jgi:hypothetical protein